MLFIRRLSKQMMNLTKQGQQRLQGKVHSAAVCLFPSLQHHLLLTNLTQVKSCETKKDRKKKIKHWEKDREAPTSVLGMHTIQNVS